ncbi:fam-a protein [Plasmodium vinckei brucechwatti]|uniref:Fam-a protein n=1 Tax=Plasmodium vinckei brucechwatti TaxID=119398 RepID=A0A6V7SR33_PLAVN|nr:fam-a protein [Plasmodium vinckei brucechwatti]
MNKGYIKIALALLSVTSYMQNIVFAHNTITNNKPSNEDDKYKAYFDPVAAQKMIEAKHAKQAKQAADIVTDALALVHKYAKHTKDYQLYSKESEEPILYFKRVNNTDIGKLEFTVPNPDNYADVVSMIWDPNGAKHFDDTFIEGHFPEVYNENLAIVQHRYASPIKSWPLFYHALAHKVELSEVKTVILLVSSNIDDRYYHFNKEYINPIVKSANSFSPYIDSEDDIRNGKLIKIYANLVGFIIEKEADCVKITYISSFNLDFSPGYPDHLARKALADRILKVIKLKEIFKGNKPISIWNLKKK